MQLRHMRLIAWLAGVVALGIIASPVGVGGISAPLHRRVQTAESERTEQNEVQTALNAAAGAAAGELGGNNSTSSDWFPSDSAIPIRLRNTFYYTFPVPYGPGTVVGYGGGYGGRGYEHIYNANSGFSSYNGPPSPLGILPGTGGLAVPFP
eukprot:TRINITY_DN26045_c0_g1_i1.p1 TRINITY_DN26045_c0_g1~~TRINITY_DN26045_c0_g1_i1.p1  ORF type:complete len:151 (-),score=23.52 TRINITY_DN26045_c0_g1_i1:241-693(-)